MNSVHTRDDLCSSNGREHPYIPLEMTRFTEFAFYNFVTIWRFTVPQGCMHLRSFPVLHCASLLRIILCVISTRALKNGSFFLCRWTTGNVQRFIIARAKPLHDSLLNPFFCDIFAAVVVCARSLLLRSIKSHDVDLSVFCLFLYLWFKPRSHWKLPNEQVSSYTGKRLYHLPMEISGNLSRNFWLNGKRPWTPKSIPESGVSC